MELLNNKELQGMNLEQLGMKIEELRRELFKLRLSAATSYIKTFPSDQKKLKRGIARILTHIRQKQTAPAA